MEAKHLNVPWTAILIFVVIVSIGILVATYQNNAEKEAAITKQFESISRDSMLIAYITWEKVNADINNLVISEAQRSLSEDQNIDEVTVKALLKASGIKGTIEYFFTPDGTRMWTLTPPKEVMDLALNTSGALKESIYNKVLKGHDVNSALWLFVINPDSTISRLKGHYYTDKDKREIKETLVDYWDSKMSPQVTNKVIEYSSNKVLANYMNGTLEEYLYKINPGRVAQIYASMDVHTFSSYFINETKTKSFAFGMKNFLANNLSKVNTNDLARLVSDGVISDEQCLSLLNQRPMHELLSQFDYQAFGKKGLDIVVKKAKFLKTPEEKAQFSQFLAENKQ